LLFDANSSPVWRLVSVGHFAIFLSVRWQTEIKQHYLSLNHDVWGSTCTQTKLLQNLWW